MRIFRSDDLPSWIVELCEMLDKPTVQLDHGAELGLVTAVKDALAWTRDRRPYEERHHRPAWNSVIEDFHATACRLRGSRLDDVVKDDLELAIRTLKVPQGANSEAIKTRAETALDGLSTRLSSAVVVTSAWADLLIASQDEGLSPSEWAWRRNLFMEVAAHGGRAVAPLASTLSGILDDRLIDVTSARARLGDVEAPARGSWPSPGTDAGLTERERVDLCERLIELDPVPARCVVCVGFDHARLAAPVCISESVVFYPAAEAKKLALAGELPRQAPVPVISEDAADYLPDGDDEVVAVIDLGISNPATALATGTANCQALIALVNAGLRNPVWKPMTGHLLLANGWWASSFTRSNRSLPPHWSDPTGTRLESLGAKVGRHLPISASMLQEVVEASERLLAAQNDGVDVAGQLLLTVRVIEDARNWGSAGTSWQTFADKFASAWAEKAVQTEIARAVFAALNEFAMEDLAEERDRAELARLRSTILVDQDGGSSLVDIQRACESLSTLASLYPVGGTPRRQLASLSHHFADGPSLARHLSLRSGQHRRLLARTVRCRNAAAHGGPLPEKTVESVLGWARIVATTLRNAALDALLKEASNDPGVVVANAYRRVTESPARRQAQLAGGADIGETLFTSDDT